MIKSNSWSDLQFRSSIYVLLHEANSCFPLTTNLMKKKTKNTWHAPIRLQEKGHLHKKDSDILHIWPSKALDLSQMAKEPVVLHLSFLHHNQSGAFHNAPGCFWPQLQDLHDLLGDVAAFAYYASFSHHLLLADRLHPQQWNLEVSTVVNLST